MPSSPEIYVPHVGWLAHPAGDEVALYLSQGLYEYREQAFLWRYVRPGDAVIDCGAHFGLFSVLAAEAMGREGTIIAIEPNPESVSLLEANFKAHGVTGATIVPAAAGSKTGKVPFYVGTAGKAAFSGLSSEIEHNSTVQVDTVTLDALCTQHGLERVAFLKIDVEGAELDVLEGADEAIRAGVFPVLMVEFTEMNLDRVGASSKDLYDVIEAKGYVVCRFDETRQELVPQPYDGPVPYDNRFAVMDVERVNERLGSCPPQHARIASEVLVRGQQCQHRYIRLSKPDREGMNCIKQHLKVILTSRYLRLGWRLGIVRKPGWVDGFLERLNQAKDE